MINDDVLHNRRAVGKQKNGRAASRLVGRLVFDCFNAKTDGRSVWCDFGKIGLTYGEVVSGTRPETCQKCPRFAGG